MKNVILIWSIIGIERKILSYKKVSSLIPNFPVKKVSFYLTPINVTKLLICTTTNASFQQNNVFVHLCKENIHIDIINNVESHEQNNFIIKHTSGIWYENSWNCIIHHNFSFFNFFLAIISFTIRIIKWSLIYKKILFPTKEQFIENSRILVLEYLACFRLRIIFISNLFVGNFEHFKSVLNNLILFPVHKL